MIKLKTKPIENTKIENPYYTLSIKYMIGDSDEYECRNADFSESKKDILIRLIKILNKLDKAIDREQSRKYFCFNSEDLNWFVNKQYITEDEKNYLLYFDDNYSDITDYENIIASFLGVDNSIYLYYLGFEITYTDKLGVHDVEVIEK